MNDRPGSDHATLQDLEEQTRAVAFGVATSGMHDIGRNIIMGGSTAAGGQTALVTTTTTGVPLNGVATSNNNNINTSGSAETSSSGSNGVHNHHPNNNNCVKRVVQGQVIKCNNNSDQSHATTPLLVTMSDGEAVQRPSTTAADQVNNRPVTASPGAPPPTVSTLTVSSASSVSATSSTSSRSSSLSTSPMPMLIRGADEDDDVSVVEEVRKVEPLKINFYREPIRTVIKLGAGQSPEVQHHSPKFKIKPIPSHIPVVSSTNESGGGEELRALDEESGTGGGIPKLHFRINHGKVQVQELPLSQEQRQETMSPVQGIPKLTIRNAMTTNCSALIGAEVVAASAIGENAMAPKLTIKMDHHSVPRLTIKTNAMGGHAIGEGVAPSEQQQHLTVPKLTIKVPNDQTTAASATAGLRDLSPGSAIISSSTSGGSGGAVEGLKLMLKKNVTHEVHNERSEEIHNHHHHHHPAALKLKVKLPRPPAVPSEEDDEDEEEEDSEPSNSDGDEARATTKTVPRIPKLTIKPVHGNNPPKKIYGTNQQHHQDNDGGHQESVTKLVIKPIPKPDDVAVNSITTTGGGMLISNHHHHHHHSRHVVGSSSSGTPVATEILPLEVSTSAMGNVGPQSPRIILKINRNQNSIVSNTTELPVMADQLTSGMEENLLKRHLQQELVNSSGSGSNPKRTRGEERIIAMIDLDDEDSKPEVEKNGTEIRLAEREQQHHQMMFDCGAGGQSVPTVLQSTKQLRNRETTDEEAIANKNSTQRIVPDDHRVLREEEDPLAIGPSDSESRLMGTAAGDVLDEMRTPVVKRGRGRPRKTPLVAREDCGSEIVTETTKKRGRKKKDDDSKVPATIENVLVGTSDTESLASPSISTAKKSRGGRGGGGTRTRGGSARRGRGGGGGVMRKPFDKQRYFKQKTFEESITSAYFEEDTRMSAADSSVSTTTKVLAGIQQDAQDSVSQSSHLSSTSVTMDSTQTSSLPARKKLKMEVVGTVEGKIEFTVDMLAEYDWPQGVGCCPSKNRDTFMIQEQIAEYLGVKSFKRKYPDLDRRTVEMEERNYLIERGLVTEKMCDLGVTAVYAVDVLDIMYQDFHDKYDQYKQYHREKIAKDLTLRQKLNKGEYGLNAREKAMRSVSKWNASLNRERQEERRIHMDLQNFTIQVPEAKRKNMTYPTPKPSIYPVALVVGQFSEYYRTYSPLELQCYPINTALTNPDDLMKRLLEEKMQKQLANEKVAAKSRAAEPENLESATVKSVDNVKSSSESSSSEDESNDSEGGDESVDTSSSESECDVNDDDLCCVCSKFQFTSPNEIPELFVKCAVCMKMAHPSCIEMSSEMAKRAFQYLWQCVDCKRCQGCQKAEDQQKMLYCQQCDRAYHIYCTKSLQALPKGAWHCDICSICRRCGCRNPDGTNNKTPKQQQQLKHQPTALHQGRRPEWRHEYAVNEATRLKEHLGMLCVRCVATTSCSGSS